MRALLPCPLCGCEPVLRKVPGMNSYIACPMCGLTTDDGDEGRITFRWNTRSRTSLEAELLEALTQIMRGYGPEHSSKFCRDTARAAIAKAAQ